MTKQATSPANNLELDLDLVLMCEQPWVLDLRTNKKLHDSPRKASWRITVQHKGGGHMRTRYACLPCAQRMMRALRPVCVPCYEQLGGVLIELEHVRVEPL